MPATVPVEQVRRGDRLLVGAGEVVPVDGALVVSAVLDESALTGEALPVERDVGDPVGSGVINAGSPFELRVTTSSAESTYAGIVRLVSAAESSRAPLVRVGDRYAVGFLIVALSGAGVAWAVGAETIGATIEADDVLAERSPSEKLDVVRAGRRRVLKVMFEVGNMAI